MNQVVIPKKQLVIFCGLAAVGKRTTIDELVKTVSNAVKFEKDMVNSVFLPPDQSNTQQYKELFPVINSKTYDLIIAQALDNLKGDTQKVAILQSYFGDKVVSKYKELICSNEYEVKIIYLHCSAQTQIKRLLERGLSRDGDKLLQLRDPSTITDTTVDPYPEYRRSHIEKHLLQLAQIPATNLLVVDTESDLSLEDNVAKIIKFLHQPTPALELVTIDKSLCQISVEDAICSACEFQKWIERAQGLETIESLPVQEPMGLGMYVSSLVASAGNTVCSWFEAKNTDHVESSNQSSPSPSP